MTQVLLYYANYVSGELVWGNSGVGVAFMAVKCIEKINTTHIKGRDLRESEFRHRKSTRKIWEIVISANMLADDDLYSFMKLFYKASYWKIRVDDVDYIVVLDDGDLPENFLENNKHLPEIQLVLIQRDPD